MIISRTPHRISFFGGGTDYPSWYLENGGKVLGTAIDKYCYITCRHLPPFFEHNYRVVYSKVETIKTIDEIQHPSVRETLRYLNKKEGVEIHHDSDIPARSGMGSSSAFTVGLLKTLHALEGRVVSKTDLYRSAIEIEQNMIRENVGSQDQVWAACGGLNVIRFMQNGEIIVDPIIMQQGLRIIFEKKFMLFFSGISRYASEIAKEQIKNTKNNGSELRYMCSLVDEAYSILTSGSDDFTPFGKLLNETWISKKKLSSQISNGHIDEMYATAMKSGALGGKLLGAGGGGFMLFYVEPELQERVKEALKPYLHIPFAFDYKGSEIIVYEPNLLFNSRTV